MSSLVVLHDQCTSARHHMELDALLIEGDEGVIPPPTLRFYTWPQEGAMTLGRFLKSKDLIEESCCIEVATRPTGGGLLLHEVSDISFSLFLPRQHPFFSPIPRENYRRIHEILYASMETVFGMRHCQQEVCTVIDAVASRPIYCMASHTPYDITLLGRKIGGSACRITQRGLLFQASLFLSPTRWNFFAPFLINGQPVTEEMQHVSSSLSNLFSERALSRGELLLSIETEFDRVFGRQR